MDRWKRFNLGLRPELELIIKANNIEIHNQSDIRINVTLNEASRILHSELKSRLK